MVLKKISKREYLERVAEFWHNGRYRYIKTASFWRLFGAEMEGDCNQVVTLYVYLYSLRFDVEDLRIRILPGHVCLHFDGVDLEATNGEFVKYEDGEVLPITELISTNLLDVSDFRERSGFVSPRVMLKSAQLAYKISSNKGLVSKNLDIIYRNLVFTALKSQDFKAAGFYAGKVAGGVGSGGEKREGDLFV